LNIPTLTIIPAGAGSGKTHTIQTQLAEWVIAGKVAPDRIVAVTFTEAAASELRERIRSELTSRGRLEDALKLEQAYITTIHGFGLRVLTEFAFDNGMSPNPRLLNEDESNILIRRALSETDRADEVMSDLTAHGYGYDFASGKGAEELFRDAVLKLIGKLRSIGRLKEDDRLIPHAVEMVTQLYGATGDSAAMKKNLHSAIKMLLVKYPNELTDLYGGNATADKALRDDFRHMKQAEKGNPLDRDWTLWQKLRKLRTISMPQDYVDLARDVMAAANALPRHPGPLKDSLVHIETLLGAGQDALDRYAEEKRDRGLVDYTDMLAIAHNLLTARSDVLLELKSRIDCLVIDEFQDTNPLEFALLWELQRQGIPTLIVGDLKQAIMGFQNADPRLMKELQQEHIKNTRPLDSNWRSTPALMNWINQVGSGLFGGEYTALKPMAQFPSSTQPLELLNFTKADKIADRIQFTFDRIRRLLADETETIYDKKQAAVRRLRAGDIAVLCPTNARLEAFAAVLRENGIRSLIEQEGWYESRIVQLLINALHYVADPSDRHAALYLCVTELGSHTLESALQALIAGETPADPLLDALQPVIAGSPDRGVETLLEEIITKLVLYDLISCWPDAAQTRANLLRLQRECREFMTANREALASGGYYGTGIKTFLAWLAGRAERENFQPEPQVIDEEAVQLITWHRSKGREWPVVIVSSTDCPVSPRLPEFSVVYEDFTDLGSVLDKALIEISPDFIASETNEIFIDRLLPDTLDSAGRLLYVALTRAREKLILEWPEFQGNRKSKGGSYWSFLKSKTEMSLSGTTLTVMGKPFACLVSTYPGATTNVSDDLNVVEIVPKLLSIGRRAIKPGAVPVNLTPETVSPSSLHDEHAARLDDIETFSYGEVLKLEISVEGAARGLFLHRCFELMSGSAMYADNLSRLTGYQLSNSEVNVILKATAMFDGWVTERLKPLQTAREIPVLAINKSGSVINGSIDLLVETEVGFWIIDHKSDQTDDMELRFARYLPQLNCYAEALTAARPDKPLLGVGINWISNGTVSMFET
jgi:ATP-dependent exoDNAse (exonuclease V) beta subunit